MRKYSTKKLEAKLEKLIAHLNRQPVRVGCGTQREEALRNIGRCFWWFYDAKAADCADEIQQELIRRQVRRSELGN